MNTNIKLKDLVWKEIDKEIELKKLQDKYSEIYLYATCGIGTIGFLDKYSEQYLKEKAEILNKPIEYTKQDIIDMFVEAGFVYDGEEYLTIKDYNLRERIKIASESLYFYIDFNGIYLETRWLDIDDIKTIEFYYTIFRNILEFEAGNE